MKKGKVTIRKAKLSDFPQLKDLKKEFYLLEAKKDPLVDKGWVRTGLPQELGRHLRSKKKAFFVAEKDKELVGYAGAQIEKCPAWKVPGKRVHLFNVYLKKNHRNKGIGTRLIASAMKWARSRGIRQLILYTYWWNSSSRRLYSRLGFREYVRMMVKPR